MRIILKSGRSECLICGADWEKPSLWRQRRHVYIPFLLLWVGNVFVGGTVYV